ncbi:uncharacterized protein OCT59_006457 [Rhizophagus irregularis]|uniref:uncharacterized protein n=1 Tax=Rhizophagus irregularis TaxID=588596 RepID=UPI00332FBBB1|nr:hypothetical protein OCT59_006457 [Rhizophagus irregularis]
MNGSALRWASEDWKSKEFVQFSGYFRRLEIQRILWHSGGLLKIGNPKNSFGTGVTSEEWKSKEFVRHWGSVSGEASEFGGLPNSKNQKRTKIRSVDFRVPKNNEKSRFVSGFVQFLDVGYIGLAFGSWVLNIWISVHGFWIYGFDFRFLGFGYINFGFRFHFKLILNRSGFHFEFLVRFFFVLLLRNRCVSINKLGVRGIPLRTLLDGRVFPSDFIRSGFLRTFIRLGEDDE